VPFLCLGLLLFGLWPAPASFLLMTALLAALVVAFTIGPQAAVVYWFRHHRAVALSLLVLAATLGERLPAGDQLGDAATLRWVATGAGVMLLLLGLPLALMLQRPQPANPSGTAQQPPPESSLGLVQAMKTRAWWLLILGLALAYIAQFSSVVHRLPYLIDAGFRPTLPVWLTRLEHFSLLPGILAFGWLADRYSKRHLLAGALLLQALGLTVVAAVPVVIISYMSAIALGVGWGGVLALTPAIRADYFGPRAFATLAVAMTLLIRLGSVPGPVLTGWLFDLAGSYTASFVSMGAILLAGAAVLMRARAPLTGQGTPRL